MKPKSNDERNSHEHIQNQEKLQKRAKELFKNGPDEYEPQHFGDSGMLVKPCRAQTSIGKK